MNKTNIGILVSITEIGMRVRDLIIELNILAQSKLLVSLVRLHPVKFTVQKCDLASMSKSK